MSPLRARFGSSNSSIGRRRRVMKGRLRLLAYQEYVDCTEIKFIVEGECRKSIVGGMYSSIKLRRSLISILSVRQIGSTTHSP